MAFSLQFELNPNDKRKFLTACDRLMANIPHASRKINQDSAYALQQNLISNISSQKFSYPAHNERYSEWKQQYGKGKGKSDFWNLYGDLLKAIQVKIVQWKDQSEFFVGIPPKIQDSGGKSWFGVGEKGATKEILSYALIMEKGGQNGKQPPRPLFEPTEGEFGASDRRSRIANQGLIRILQSWR